MLTQQNALGAEGAALADRARTLGLAAGEVAASGRGLKITLDDAPTAEEVAQARRVIAAFDLPENKDKGVIALDGRMVERLHADMARRTVAIAEAIEARQA